MVGLMVTVGAFEAKTHLSSLLERVSRGEEVLITRHGKAVAKLVPADTADRRCFDDAIEGLKAARRGVRLDGLDWKALRGTGRR